MVTGLDVVDARSMGHSYAIDRDLTLPERPRFIPELVVLPLGDDGLMVCGGDQPQVFRGRSARGLLLRVLPLLDGEHTLQAIAQRHPGLRVADLRDIVSLLTSRGLLEDGMSEPAGEPLADVSGFIGRHLDGSLSRFRRTAVLRDLAAATVVLVGPPRLGELVGDDLRASGVGRVHVCDGTPTAATLTIVLSTGATCEAAARHVPQAQARTLLVRLGGDTAHIGPLLIDGVTACPSCVDRIHPHPLGVPDALLTRLWLGQASLVGLLALAGLATGLPSRGFRVQRIQDGELTDESRLAVRLPGCARCGIAGEPWAPDDPRMAAWIYHTATSMPSHAMLSPKDHQAHYLVGNARLASERRRLMWSAVSASLPVRGTSVTADASLSVPPGAPGDLDATALGALLVRIAGEIADSAHARRLVPTGGNLGSVSLWTIVRSVPGLAPGAYVFDAHRNALDFVSTVSDDALRRALRTSAPLPECLIVGGAALAKCAQKYGAFAYRLVHLDAGIALSYAHLVAAELGLELREYADFDLGLPGSFGIPSRWELPLPTFALGVGSRALATGCDRVADAAPAPPLPPVEPAHYSDDVLRRLLDDTRRAVSPRVAGQPPRRQPHRAVWAHPLERLDGILLARRAIREFGPTSPSADVLDAVAGAASDAVGRRLAAGGPPCFVRAVVALAAATDGFKPGVYDVDRESSRMTWRGEFSPAIAEQCSNQETLAAAPATLLMIGDMRCALTERGSRGYAELALHAGAAIGEAWLRATALDCVGTAAGGVIWGGLRRAAGMDGFHECPLLALHLGQPAPEPPV